MQEFTFIRHAPVDHQGRLYGRLDLPAVLPGGAPPALPDAQRYLTSPAQRCRQTARWLGPACDWQVVDALWEQDFGQTEGLSYSALPELGPLSRSDLAAYRPAGGESFRDLAARLSMFLHHAPRTAHTVIMAHAGVIRAALGLALGDVAAGLAFTIDPLSHTRIRRFGDDWSVAFVNRGL